MRASGLSGSYELFELPPGKDVEVDLTKILFNLRNGEIMGLNITIPYKETVLPLLDELTPTAARIGAVNTLYKRQQRIVGDNTDAQGFLNDLARLGFANRLPEGKEALVLGAGGAARAVVYALTSQGWVVYVAARRIEQAQQLVQQIDPVQTRVFPAGFQAQTFTRAYSLIINTTPLGMRAGDVSTPWLERISFPETAAVYDLVYHQTTQLLQDARAAGLPAANGLGMLIEQAALSFSLWTGLEVPRAALWQAVSPSVQSDQQ